MNRREMLVLGAGAALWSATSAGAAPVAPKGPELEFVFEAIVDVAPLEDLGPGPLGQRRIVPITGGTFEGPAMRGIVRPGGADRQLIRADGARMLSALYELQTDDGAVLTILNRVLIDEPPGKPRYAFSTPEVTAPRGKYDWLNRCVFVGTLNSMRPARDAVRVGFFKVV